MKLTNILLGILIIIGASFFFKNQPLGSGNAFQSTYYYRATDSSSSIPLVATTTNPILSLDTLRTNALVCYRSGTSTIWLHQLSQATTTGVNLNSGIPLATSSIAEHFGETCYYFPQFKGYLFGISNSPATTSISYWQ